MDSDRKLLLEQALRGVQDSRGPLLETYRPYLQLLARVEVGRRFQSKIDAGDIVQETFVEAHRNFENFRGASERAFLAWLKKILAAQIGNVVRHFVGTRGRDVRRERGFGLNLDQSSRDIDRGLLAVQSTPSQQLRRRELGEELARAMSRLPADYREVIVLRHFEELAFTDVARRMDRSTDAVQKLWIRGLARLRNLMKEVS